MIVIVIAALLLLGGTTWLAQDNQLAHNRGLNRKATTVGLALCVITVITVVGAAVASVR